VEIRNTNKTGSTEGISDAGHSREIKGSVENVQSDDT